MSYLLTLRNGANPDSYLDPAEQAHIEWYDWGKSFIVEGTESALRALIARAADAHDLQECHLF